MRHTSTGQWYVAEGPEWPLVQPFHFVWLLHNLFCVPLFEMKTLSFVRLGCGLFEQIPVSTVQVSSMDTQILVSAVQVSNVYIFT